MSLIQISQVLLSRRTLRIVKRYSIIQLIRLVEEIFTSRLLDLKILASWIRKTENARKICKQNCFGSAGYWLSEFCQNTVFRNKLEINRFRGWINESCLPETTQKSAARRWCFPRRKVSACSTHDTRAATFLREPRWSIEKLWSFALPFRLHNEFGGCY